MSKNNEILRLDKKEQSQLDLGGVLRSAHDDRSQSLRVVNGITSVPSSYSRVDITYNVSNSVTRAVFYEGTLSKIVLVETVADVASSLNNTYFQLYSENDESLYHVWFNVDAAGTDPAPTGSIGIEVPLSVNDSAEFVAIAIEIVLRNVEEFCITRAKNCLLIENVRKGKASDPVNSGTGFTLSTHQEGAERVIKSIDIPYDGKSKYLYNAQDRRFEVFPVSDLTVDVDIDADNGDNIAISRHQNYRNLVFSATKLDTDLSTTAYTNFLTYTATENLRIRAIRIKADTFGVFRLKIDGVIRDYKYTSNFERNCLFEFLEDEDFPDTKDIEIDFVPERIKLSTYDFFTRIEAYVD
jgi:hypothetical protein